jgi:2-polyprenyl-3-methyl-5-hydroxy-6-metoxy-1,4-benzoquinol methylase
MEIKSIPLVNEIMKKNVTNKVSIDLIHEMKDKVLDRFIEGALFIVDNDDSLVGIITDGDVRKCFSSAEEHDIENFITFNPQTIDLHESSSIALRILREKEINILPVVSDDNKIEGFITLHLLLDNFSPERLYMTGTELEVDDNEERHLARYKFALNFIKGGMTLDCACGSGYGSKILEAKSDNVLGVDLSHEAIEFANQNNSIKSIEYKQGNIDHLEFENSSLDNIVSIETLEHVPNDVFLRFLENIELWLKDGGVFIGSSPMLRYKDGKPYITNPYHINEMPRDEFTQAVVSRLKNFEVHFYYQDQDTFLPLCKENTGFCIVVARKGKE